MSFNKILTTVVVLVIIGLGVVYFTKYKKPMTNNNPQQSSQQTAPQSSDTANTTPTAPTDAEVAAVPASAIATIDTNLGSFQVTLDGKAAPKTVANFIKLANAGFYNN